MAYPERLQKLIEEANWAIYVCTNPDCKNSVGEPSHEEACGIPPASAPPTMKCPDCGSSMKKEN